MKIFKKILSLALVGAMLLSASIAFTGCSDSSFSATSLGESVNNTFISSPNKNQYGTVIDNNGNRIDGVASVNNVSAMNYILRRSVSPVGEPLQTQTLSCTVTPSYASDKTTIWSVAWAEGAAKASESIEDYIQLVVNEENSNICTVNLMKSFGTDDVIVTVKTVVGTFEDSVTLRCFESVKIDTGSRIAVNVAEAGYSYPYIDDFFSDHAEYEGNIEEFYYLNWDEITRWGVNIDERYRDSYSINVTPVASDYYVYEFSDSYTILGSGDKTISSGYSFAFKKPAISPAPFLYDFVDGAHFNISTYLNVNDYNVNYYNELKSKGYDLSAFDDPSVWGNKINFNTVKPVLYCIEVSESVFNTSDRIYVSMFFEPEAIEASEDSTFID